MVERDPAVKETVNKATIALVTTSETGEKVVELGAKCVRQIPDVAFSDQELDYFTGIGSSRDTTFRAICIGRLLYWKGFHLALRAFAKFHAEHPMSELWMVNDGPERPRLEALAASLGIRDSVRFWGRLSNLKEVHARLSQSDVLVHPALRESFGNVCLEAMALAKPVICLNTGGPATQVTSSTGFVVSVDSEERAVETIARSLGSLYCSPDRGRKLGLAGRQRVVDEFSSEIVFGRVNEIYAQLAAGRSLAQQVAVQSETYSGG
jgi:glycosyltransferase involved in cell wall biosynthesis